MNTYINLLKIRPYIKSVPKKTRFYFIFFKNLKKKVKILKF